MSATNRDIFKAFRTLIIALARDIADSDYVELMRDIAREANDIADSVEAHAACRRYPPGTRVRFVNDTDTGHIRIHAGVTATIDSCDADHIHATLDNGSGYCEWSSVQELENDTEVVS